jgi:isopentenyldiphosphate isomerase
VRVVDEFVDVVDSDDTVIGRTTRRQMRTERLRHRAVFVMVRDSAGRLLIHRRSDTKDLWPGWWDIAVGGVVAAGELFVDAAHRELAEEVGVVDAPLVALGGGRYVDDDVDLIGRCWLAMHDGPVVFADGEVAEARWVDGAELAEHRARYRFVPDSVALFDAYFPLWRMDCGTDS